MADLDEVSLGKALQAARRAAGLTQQDLCQRANLSYSTLAKIERGAIKAPSIFTIQTIAQVLGVELADLLAAVSPAAGRKSQGKKTSKSGVKFVYFDINGCLVRFFHRAFTAIAEASGQKADVIETAFWRYNDGVCRGEMTVEKFNLTLGEAFGLKDFDWRDYYLEAIEPIKQMHHLLDWVNKHYHVGLLSNIMPGQIDTMLKKALLPRVNYAAIIDSSIVKAIKPETAIYEVATTKARVKAEEILLIDDSRANLGPAQQLGWRVLWFDDYRPDESIERIRSALELSD